MPNQENKPESLQEQATRYAVLISVLGIVIIMLILIIKFLLSDSLSSLADIKVTRGLITFVFVMMTVLVALILTFYNIFTEDKEESEKKFTRGKELLTVLIGIVGTIIGFYFGTATDEKNSSSLNIAPVLVLTKDSTATIITHISGGTAPYAYTISFPKFSSYSINEKQTSDGWIQEQIVIHAEQKNSTLEYEIRVTDSKQAVKNYTPSKNELLRLQK